MGLVPEINEFYLILFIHNDFPVPSKKNLHSDYFKDNGANRNS